MTITDSRHNRRGTGTAKSDNRWAIAFHSQKPFPLCPVRVGRSVRVGPLVESLPPAFKRLQSPARDRGKLQPSPLNSHASPQQKRSAAHVAYYSILLTHFRHPSINSSKTFVAGSPVVPRLSLSFLWFVSFAPKTVVFTPAAFSTVPRRNAWAVVSG